MPLLKSSIKANKQNIKRRERNKSFVRKMKSTMKSIIDATTETKENAEKNASLAFSYIDRAVKKNILKKNTASRRKARLSRVISSIGGEVKNITKLEKKSPKVNPKKVVTPKKETTKEPTKKPAKKVTPAKAKTKK